MQDKDFMFTLKAARTFRGYTQAEAAVLLGCSKDVVSNFERGKTYPDIPMLRKIEEVYEIPYHRLLFLPLDYDKTVRGKEEL